MSEGSRRSGRSGRVVSVTLGSGEIRFFFITQLVVRREESVDLRRARMKRSVEEEENQSDTSLQGSDGSDVDSK
ncbi:unnamed protein product [Microthlaspi erraticum]|uniref:Uncharacterized protein n=1 Tax=Microthlaspi erraticum TaxID=1685480 RepID=A0A6D2HFK5_9BRAS|nr:unnamed protein product [Microthlaspi erraticum]